MRNRWAAGASALLLALVSVAAPGASRAAPEDEDLQIISIGQNVKLEDLLRSLGSVLSTPLIWSESDKAIQGKTITGTQDIVAPRGKLFDVVRALLTFYELIVVPIGPKGYEVYLVMDAQQQARIVRLKPVYVELNEQNIGEYESQDGLFIATTIKVNNIGNLTQARQAFTRITTQQIGNVQEVPAARAFVVTDFAPNVVAIYRLIRQMDVEPEGKQIRQAFIPLSNALAEDIEPILVDLFTGRQRFVQNVPGQPQGGDIFDIEPRIISDPRTNQIIVYGIDEDIVEITDLVRALDQQLVIRRQRVWVVRLNNLDAVDTAQVLRDLIEGTTLFGATTGSLATSRRTSTGARATPARPGQPATPAAGVSVSPDLEEKPTVVADEASNSLIIAGSEAQYQDLKLIIDQIDIRKSQVLIEAALVELSLDDSYRFAIELAGIDDTGLGDHGAASGFGATSFGLTEFFDRDGDGVFTDRLPPFVGEGGPAPGGVIGGIFAAGQVPLIYNALETVKKTKILQLPSIVTSDNQEATIEVKDEQAVTESTVTSGGNTNAGFGGFEEAGTTLSISPHIANEQFLLLHITLEVSGFQGAPRIIGNAQIPAERFTRRIETTVTIPDRHTVVLGGLIGSNQTSTVDRVPFLGEIPILGELFKGTNRSTIETNLFLFVTPTILRNTDLTFSDYDRVTCDRKKKADELIGVVDIPFANFVGCRTGRCIDPATGMVRGSGSASDRLDRAGLLEETRFQNVDADRLAAEALARKRALRLREEAAAEADAGSSRRR
jgi:general secretion pathway protein D